MPIVIRLISWACRFHTHMLKHFVLCVNLACSFIVHGVFYSYKSGYSIVELLSYWLLCWPSTGGYIEYFITNL